MPVRIYKSFESLPEGYDRLFEEAGKQSLYLSRGWFDLLYRACRQPGHELRIYGYERKDGPQGLLPAWNTQSRPERGAGRSLSSLSNWYSGIFGPVARSEPGIAERTMAEIVSTILSERPRWDSIHLMPMEQSGKAYHALLAAFRRHGMLHQTYQVSADWYEPFDGKNFEDYWMKLSSKKRNTLRRKEKRLTALPGFEMRLYTDLQDIDRAIADYEQIYLKSWKEPEQFAEFVPMLIRLSAKYGTLRLGIAYIDGVPAASELCIVAARSALMMKTAYDPQFRDLSVGAIATWRVLKHVLDNDGITEIDFGNGDDPYKREWVSQRRVRVGVVGFNPGTVRGVLGAARNIGGRSLKTGLRDMFTPQPVTS